MKPSHLHTPRLLRDATFTFGSQPGPVYRAPRTAPVVAAVVIVLIIWILL